MPHNIQTINEIPTDPVSNMTPFGDINMPLPITLPFFFLFYVKNLSNKTYKLKHHIYTYY